MEVGRLNTTWCGNIIDVTLLHNASRLTVSRADVFWFCGNNRLLNVLPSGWTGICTEISLVSPVEFLYVVTKFILTTRLEP